MPEHSETRLTTSTIAYSRPSSIVLTTSGAAGGGAFAVCVSLQHADTATRTKALRIQTSDPPWTVRDARTARSFPGMDVDEDSDVLRCLIGIVLIGCNS